MSTVFVDTNQIRDRDRPAPGHAQQTLLLYIRTGHRQCSSRRLKAQSPTLAQQTLLLYIRTGQCSSRRLNTQSPTLAQQTLLLYIRTGHIQCSSRRLKAQSQTLAQQTLLLYIRTGHGVLVGDYKHKVQYLHNKHFSSTYAQDTVF